MTILALKKVTLYGLSGDKQQMLDALQQLGCMHLISLQTSVKTSAYQPSERADDAYKALRYLLDTPVKRRPLQESRHFDFDQVVKQTLTNKQQRRDTEDHRDFLARRIRDLKHWGNFQLPDENALLGYRLWFYKVPVNKKKLFEELQLPWQIVHSDPRYDYVVLIAREEPPHDAMPVPRTHTGAVALEELKRQLYQTEIELEELAAERHALSRWLILLSQNLAHAEDTAALNYAATQTLDQKNFFALQGWLPERDTTRLEDFTQQHGLALLLEPPGLDEQPPTLLANPPALNGGQDLVAFYQTPGYRTWDPSTMVFFSFVLFFAMILADAGYALVLGAVIAYFWKRMGNSTGGRGFRRMAVLGLVMAVIYGVMVGSFFGISPAPGSVLSNLNVLNINDINFMMKMSIIIGCVHLSLANAIVAYHASDFAARLQPLGWIAAIWGGLLLWLYQASNAGPVLLIGGLSTVALFAGNRRVDSLKTLLLRILDGLKALSGVSGMFGDILSYLRLFALGLSSASLAITFNQLAEQIREGLPGLGLLLSILVLILGHGINLGLGIISGFVHGLRLNFLEFFKWGIAQEGYLFQPFAKKEVKHE